MNEKAISLLIHKLVFCHEVVGDCGINIPAPGGCGFKVELLFTPNKINIKPGKIGQFYDLI